MLNPDDAWIARLDKALRDRLGGDARAWLDEALAEATAHGATGATAHATTEATGRAAAEAPAAAFAFAHSAAEAPGAGTPAVWEMRFASAGRWCVREEPPRHPDPEATEAARVLILCTARADGPTVTRLYEHGTAAERRAVLLALPRLPLGTDGRAGLPLIEDALRTNDTRLVAAAVGPYAARHLDAHAWRHAVLKCLFTGVSVDAVAGLAERSRGDGELARMLGDYARERTSAGRPVPDDLSRVLALTQMSPLSADTSPGSSVSPYADRSGNPFTGPSGSPSPGLSSEEA
ncbi:EboA domain-containing protein [Streptomyces sp. NPDC053560]|uniref:EboA domain-containing protein n=1 Tax=Streptomyces sp. NPDC053560 TaxID=3365711 RepID=UPI0037CD4FD8